MEEKVILEKFGFFKWLESLSVAAYSAVFMDTPDIVRHSYIQKWLRDKHNIHISFKPVFGKKNYKKYKYNIYINEKITQVMKYEFPDNVYFDSYEEATQACLQKSLELIKID